MQQQEQSKNYYYAKKNVYNETKNEKHHNLFAHKNFIFKIYAEKKSIFNIRDYVRWDIYYTTLALRPKKCLTQK